MAIEMAQGIAMKLCEAWGLDPNMVGRIRITIDPLDIAKAEVTIFIDAEVTEHLLTLRPVDDKPAEDTGAPF